MYSCSVSWRQQDIQSPNAAVSIMASLRNRHVSHEVTRLLPRADAQDTRNECVAPATDAAAIETETKFFQAICVAGTIYSEVVYVQGPCLHSLGSPSASETVHALLFLANNLSVVGRSLPSSLVDNQSSENRPKQHQTKKLTTALAMF